MFLELMKPNEIHRGWIEVITGSMFSGKTEELIRRLRRAQIANQTVGIFKPIIDDRYDKTDIVSHDNKRIPSTPVAKSTDILDLVDGIQVVGIDEAQFFDEGIVDVITTLADSGVRVILAGLDMDYQRKPFAHMPEVISVAEFVTKLHAICTQCGNIAGYSYRLVDDDAQVLIGEKKEYEPRCRVCYNSKI